MKQTKRVLALVLSAMLCMMLLAGCTNDTTPSNDGTATSTTAKEKGIDIRMAVLKGPTGVGAVNLWNKQDAGKTTNNYTIELATEPQAIINKFANDQIDIAAMPTNAAAALYAKTNGNIQVLAVNTLGVLYMMENGNTIESVADLKGKTIYSTGQGANPEYVLKYILEKNGLNPDEDVTIKFVAENQELSTLIMKGEATIAMVPEPLHTTLKTKNQKLRTALDMTAEWEAVSGDDSALMMGCVVAKKDFVKNNPDGIRTFLQEYESSIASGDALREETGKLCAKYGIIDDANIAANAIVGCNMTFVQSDRMKEQLSGYLEVLFNANSKSVGGKLPDDAFYYLGENR